MPKNDLGRHETWDLPASERCGMICCALVVSTAALVAAIPVPQSVERFPDPSWWPGTGTQQVGNMLVAIHRDAGEAFRTGGPGPGQIMKRWRLPAVTENERVSILLGGATFHHTALLPAYVDAFRHGNLRLRRAAAVGLAWLLGDPPVDPTKLGDDPKLWESFVNYSEALLRGLKQTSLVQMWINSYYVAKGIPHHGITINRPADACLAAIREIAEPEDLNEIVALWPLLDKREQYGVTTTLEMITGHRVTEVPSGPRAPSGGFLYDAAAQRMDAWVDGVCRTLDGPRTLREGLAREVGSTATTTPTPAPYVQALDLRYAPHWPIAAETLTGWGAPAVDLDRQAPDDPANDTVLRRVRWMFPITRDELRKARDERVNPRPK